MLLGLLSCFGIRRSQRVDDDEVYSVTDDGLRAEQFAAPLPEYHPRPGWREPVTPTYCTDCGGIHLSRHLFALNM